MHSVLALGSSSSAPRVLAPKFGQRTGLPLVRCPKCGEEIMELTSGAGSKVPGAIFFKCRLHERDVPGSCPWYLFADKYERMLITKGIVEKTRPADIGIRTEESQSGVLGNKTELAPLLVGRDRVDEKLHKLIDLVKIVALILVVIAVFVVVGVIVMFFK